MSAHEDPWRGDSAHLVSRIESVKDSAHPLCPPPLHCHYHCQRYHRLSHPLHHHSAQTRVQPILGISSTSRQFVSCASQQGLTPSSISSIISTTAAHADANVDNRILFFIAFEMYCTVLSFAVNLNDVPPSVSLPLLDKDSGGGDLHEAWTMPS